MPKIFFALALLIPLAASAQGDGNANDDASAIKALGFGLAIGVEQYRNPYIEEASTNGTNRVVTVDKEYKSLPSAWLTINWNFLPLEGARSGQRIFGAWSTTDVKGGLFAGVKLVGAQNNQTFDSFAIGPQVTFKTNAAGVNRDICLGLGFVSHKTRGLANGIIEGQPLPTDYTDIKYRQRTENSWLLMLSVVL